MSGTTLSGDPAAVVRRWLDEVWMAGDLDAVDELVAERYVRHGPSGTVVRDRDALRDDMRQYFRVLHKPVITVDDQAVAGDRVWTRMTIEGVDLEAGTTRADDLAAGVPHRRRRAIGRVLAAPRSRGRLASRAGVSSAKGHVGTLCVGASGHPVADHAQDRQGAHRGEGLT